MSKAQQKTKTESKSKVKLIPFLNGKKLTSEKHPSETIYLHEPNYESLMKAQKEGKLSPSNLDTAARNIVKYRKAERERKLEDLFPQAS